MLALSPARDLFALSSSTTSTTKTPFPLDHHHSSVLPSFPSYRQPPFVETPSQRRARVAFSRKEYNRQGEGKIVEERVESWVREQVQQSTFMITTAARMSFMNDKAVKGHMRILNRRQGGAPTLKPVPDEIVLRRMLKDSSNLLSPITEEEDEEPYILYSTPLPRYSTYPTPAPYYNSSPPSPTRSSPIRSSPRIPANSPTKPLHQRRFSDLQAIPEGLEE
ncbi:hypothetical protein GG344DRAFT_76199 [Lentinula edodes]|nr:hypothetical protein GG344DRAFT_76199 [Lentinula edodes]